MRAESRERGAWADIGCRFMVCVGFFASLFFYGRAVWVVFHGRWGAAALAVVLGMVCDGVAAMFHREEV